MSSADKTALAKRDGTLEAIVKEITRLHSEILSAARTSLAKAVQIGGLLSRVRASRKGKWLAWIKDSVPFSDQTARNYIRVYQNRDDPRFKTVLNLRDVYGMLCEPSKTATNTHRRELTNVSPIPAQSDGEHVALGPHKEPQPTKRRRAKRKETVMDQISTENQKRDLQQGQREIDKQLSDIIQQIGRQADSQSLAGLHWFEFPDRLAVHGNALIQQGERLRDGNTQ